MDGGGLGAGRGLEAEQEPVPLHDGVGSGGRRGGLGRARCGAAVLTAGRTAARAEQPRAAAASVVNARLTKVLLLCRVAGGRARRWACGATG